MNLEIKKALFLVHIDESFSLAGLSSPSGIIINFNDKAALPLFINLF